MSPTTASYKKLDWTVIICYLLLSFFGWLNIYASSYSEEAQGIFSLAGRSGNQILWIGIALVTASVILFILGPRFFKSIAWPLYGLSILLLIAVLIFGHEVNGSKSWLSLFGGVAVQPSEFSKIATALCIAKIMGTYGFSISNTSDFLKLAATILLPVILIALEPDIGTILVYCSLAFVLYREGLPGQILGFSGFAVLLFMLTLKFSPFVSLMVAASLICMIWAFYTKRPIRNMLFCLTGIIAASFIPRLLRILPQAWADRLPAEEYWIMGLLVILTLIYFLVCLKRNIKGKGVYVIAMLASIALIFSVDIIFHNALKQHHRDRIENLLGISEDLTGAGYNVNQSKIAIGSGGLTGKGFLQGTQTKYNFVPEQSTDFIFCTIGEEWGFVGSLLVLALYFTMILRIVFSAERQKDRGVRVYGYCLASYLFVHVVVNIGMTIGLMPVVGIPLPFISYGGSSFLAFTTLLFIYLRFDIDKK